MPPLLYLAVRLPIITPSLCLVLDYETLRPLSDAAGPVGLIYIVLFTCAVNYIAEQVFRFTVFAKPQAVVITVALAASVLFASPLLPFCRRLFERCGAKCRHYFDRAR